MHRSGLKNVFNKNRTPKTQDSYKIQRNFCVNLFRKTIKEYFENINVDPIQDGPFRGCPRMGVGAKRPLLLKICHTHPAITNLGTVIPYLKKTQKYVNHLTHRLGSADISIFYQKSANFSISRNADIDCILIHNFQFF